MPKRGLQQIKIKDKCNPPPVDMGQTILFAGPIPGVNDTFVRPFGWTEYEAAYRPQYVPVPGQRPNICRDPCVNRKPGKWNKKPECVSPCRYPRSDLCTQCKNARCSCPIPPPWAECKEKITIYNSDNIRHLIVHGELKNEHPLVLSNDDYQRIIERTKAKSKEDKKMAECLQKLKCREAERKRAKEQVEEMKRIDNFKLSQLVNPEKQADMHEVLCRAKRLVKEDEPEMRSINKAILAAKVQAIREAQLTEKEIMKCEMQEEERRLNAMMTQNVEDQENSFLKSQAEEARREEEKKIMAARALEAQINEREGLKYREKVRVEEETKLLKSIWDQWKVDEMQKKAQEIEKRHELGEEQLRELIDVTTRKQEMRQLDRLQEQRALEWQMEKLKEEEQIAREKMVEKKRRDLDLMAQISAGPRGFDEKAVRIERRANRHMEEQEREWRRRELEAAERKHCQMVDLRAGIVDQIRDKNQQLIEMAVYEKAIYDRMVEAQTSQDNKVEEEKNDAIAIQRAQQQQYRQELKAQIHADQVQRIKERKDYFVDGFLTRKSYERRDEELKCFLEQKIQELRDANLPEKYIGHVRRAIEDEVKPDWQKSVCAKPKV